MYTLYDYLDSGNGYKIRLLLSQLQIGYRYVEADIMRGETRTKNSCNVTQTGAFPCSRSSRACIWQSPTPSCGT